MSFLFGKSKKNAPAPSAALPPASRNIHTSDGHSAPTLPVLSEKIDTRKAQSPPPNNNANGSLNSLNEKAISSTSPPVTQPVLTAPQAPFARRDRSNSEAGPRPPQPKPAPHTDLYPWSQKPLTFQNPQANPFPRYGAAVNSVASKEGDIYLMGGLIDGENVRGDLWMVEAANASLQCYPIATVSEGPGPRVGHASLLVGNAFIVFGGDTKQDDTDILDDTLYLLNTTSRQWSRASPPGPRPSGRYGHTLNILGSRIYIFGGQVEGSFYNDLIAFDLNAFQNPSNQWDFLTPNVSTVSHHASLPPARTNHTMISHNDMLYLFGGTDGKRWFNDVWTYDPKANRWTQQDCIGYIPAPREGHSAALVNDVMYVFGGRTEHGDDLGDLAAFRISLRRWYTFQNMGPSPSPRSGHSMTAFGKQIIVLAGEPSSAPRNDAELSLAYILDTAKIRYPNDAPATQPTRQTSDPLRNTVVPRSVQRETPLQQQRVESPKEGINGGPVQRPDTIASRLPRASTGPGPNGPPPANQPPNPRPNGMTSPTTGATARANPGMVAKEQVAQQSVPEQNGISAADIAPSLQSIPVRNDSKDVSRSSREQSPASYTKRTTSQPVSKAKAMEAGEAAPLVGAAVARQRSQRSQRGHTSVDGSDDGSVGRLGSRPHIEHRHSKTFAEEPNSSPNITPHHEALMKELEAVKSKNAWYASELALAKKSGYAATSSPNIDDRGTLSFADEDRPLMEAFMTMRSELARMQQTMDQQAKTTAQRIAEVEHQRDAAVTEAAYARAKLAAHGGSQRSTPQLGSVRDSDEAERSTDISRRLALSLAAANEHKTKLEALTRDLESERRARTAAEEAVEASQTRFDKLSSSRNPGEIEALRAELHETQSFARAETGRRSEIEQKMRMLEVDHKDLQDKHKDISSQMTDHFSSLASLETAVAASTSKAAIAERQLEEERQEREGLERRLAVLKSEHEDKIQELENTHRRLRETNELADAHAKEAKTHREALLAGVAKMSKTDPTLTRYIRDDDRVIALQEAVDEANKIAKTNEEAAETAAQKLRSAEERIAGLEAYQEQSSREGLTIRRQLQAALRDMRTHESENRDLRTQLETHQRDTSALAVQHSTLKNLLGERGVDMAGNRRSPASDANGSRNNSPEAGRARELEQQLSAAHKAHDDTKSMYESREVEAEKAYRERLEQLENDYQSLLTYVKGTEKMLKKMKEELTKYKSSNQKLTSELEATRDGKRSVDSHHTDAGEWANERDAMQHAISEMKAQMTSHIQLLESNMASVKSDLEKAQKERDEQKASHEVLSKSIQNREKELSELRTVNSHLETRALDAEHRVTMLLDQVDQSVNNYRRASQINPTGTPHTPATANVPAAVHNRELSQSTTTDSINEPERDDTRGSLALENLASELETLKVQWQSQQRNYRLSDRFDFERTPTREHHDGVGLGLGESIANWRAEGLGSSNTSSIAGPPASSTQPTNTSTGQNHSQSNTMSPAAAAAAAAVLNAGPSSSAPSRH